MEPKQILENEHWLIVDKPENWLTVPSRLGEQDPRPCLGRYLEKKSNSRLWPVHRLDFEVSGLILFAKNAQAHRLANGWFEAQQVKKTYQALSRGPVAQDYFVWQVWRSRLVRGKRRSFVAEHGQEAVTRVVCLKENENIFYWQLEPMTGRSHQLRVEMSRHGFALLGDTLYGGEAWLNPGIALRAHSLDFNAIQSLDRLGLPDTVSAPLNKIFIEMPMDPNRRT